MHLKDIFCQIYSNATNLHCGLLHSILDWDPTNQSGITNGCWLIIGRKGEVAHRSVHGYADRDAGRRMTDGDVFATISVGKQMTAVFALTRIDRGDLHLHMRVGDIIPESRERGLRTTTLFHLLTHTSGSESE